MTEIPTRIAGQMTAFPSPVEVSSGPLTLTAIYSLQRTPRQKCRICGNRRVCFSIISGDQSSAPMCAKCAGIR